MTFEKQTCEFIPVSSLVSGRRVGALLIEMSENALFSWGDNDRTLVGANRIADHCESLGYADDDGFVAALRSLGTTCVDLES